MDVPLGVWILSRWKRFDISFRSSKSGPLWGVHSISLPIFLLEVTKPEWSLCLSYCGWRWGRRPVSPRPLLQGQRPTGSHLASKCPGIRGCPLPPESLALLPILSGADWLPVASSPHFNALGSSLLRFTRNKWGLIWWAGPCWCFVFLYILPS